MKQLGDITRLHGWDMTPVDIITGGSPCQDLSVAGKRAGLGGERSGLFTEYVRIVREMREATGRDGGDARPRFMVWENVAGSFTSNKGRDFQRVLTEVVRIADPEAPDVPMPEKGGWSHAGLLYSEMGAWSVAWRTHDAQYWGTPQRRKRIALVADFGGGSAAEILFEPEGLPGDPEQGGEEGQEAPGATGTGLDGTSWEFEPGAAKRLNPEGRFWQDISPTLRADMGDNQVATVIVLDDRKGPEAEEL